MKHSIRGQCDCGSPRRGWFPAYARPVHEMCDCCQQNRAGQAGSDSLACHPHPNQRAPAPPERARRLSPLPPSAASAPAAPPGGVCVPVPSSAARPSSRTIRGCRPVPCSIARRSHGVSPRRESGQLEVKQGQSALRHFLTTSFRDQAVEANRTVRIVPGGYVWTAGWAGHDSGFFGATHHPCPQRITFDVRHRGPGADALGQ